MSLLLAVAGMAGCKQNATENDVAKAIQSGGKVVADAAPTEQSSAQAAATSEQKEAKASPEQEASPEQRIRESLTGNLPRLSIVSFKESHAPGIYQVEINGGEVIHVTADGKHIINGDLLAIQPGGVENITETWRSKKRVDALQSLKDEDLVVYQAEGEEKGEIIAFTDTSCGYCRKFHQEIPQLNAMGITVKYAAWPRYGLQSPAGQTMAHIWCSSDREHTMTLAKTSQPVPKPEGKCNTKVIDDQIALGREVGVRGTPAVYLSDGRKVGGYREAAELAAELNIAATGGQPSADTAAAQ